MNPHRDATERRHAADAVQEDSIIDWLLVLARRRTLLLAAPLLCAVLAAGVALVLPNVYRSEARILPPQQSQSSAAIVLGQLGGAAGIAGGALGLGGTGDLYLGMLRSRSVADQLIARFDLKRLYGVALAEEARRELARRTSVAAGKDSIITIAFEDRDPALAAKVANAYVDELFKLTSGLAMTSASRQRLFYARELAAAKDQLAQVETRLKGALDASGVVSVDSQLAGVVGTSARLRAQISLKEVELGAMRAFVTPQSQPYQRAQQELLSMRAELGRLENGRAAGTPAGAGQAGLDNIKLLRDVKYHQMLYEMLAKQYESARLNEARDPAMIQVIDAAIAAEHKAKPQRALIVLLSAFVGLCAAILWIFLSEAVRRNRANRPADQRLAPA